MKIEFQNDPHSQLLIDVLLEHEVRLNLVAPKDDEGIDWSQLELFSVSINGDEYLFGGTILEGPILKPGNLKAHIIADWVARG